MGVRINPTAQFQTSTHVRTFKMLKMLWMWCGYIPSVFNVHQTLRVEVSIAGLITEIILSQKCHTVYVHMGPICNGC
jgi:hypothetical protein